MEPPLLLDPSRADVRVDFGMARAWVALENANKATAEQWAAVADTLDEARAHPGVFLAESAALAPAERVSYAIRAAAADLAVRLAISESSVRAQDVHSHTLQGSMPQLWAEFVQGRVAPANARTAADLVATLPDEREVRARFDAELTLPAHRLAPARFRARARALRDRLCAADLAERAAAARQLRGVWLDDDIDGMAWLTLRLPAVDAHRAYAAIDDAARALQVLHGEDRTLAQLRADNAVTRLIERQGKGSGARVSVAVTVPVMTLLGHSEEPGTLDGYGPIDADTARKLAGQAPSFTRLLVHPVTSAILDVDRTTYRVPADLKRWLEVRDRTCVFPGCGRPARRSDIDHTVAWEDGGGTCADNLAHLCRHHHRLKHLTRWTMRQRPGRRTVWTSPTGNVRTSDPPPF